MKTKGNYLKDLIWMILLMIMSWYIGDSTKIYGVAFDSQDSSIEVFDQKD